MLVFKKVIFIYQHYASLTRANIMTAAKDDKVSSRHLQLPLGFHRTAPADLKQVMVFLDERFSSDPPVLLSQVFSRFSDQPETWTGARIAGIISSLFSDRMISCLLDGNASLQQHSSVFLEASDQWGRIHVVPRKRLQAGEMQAVAGTCKMLFGSDCPADQDALTHFLSKCIKQRKASLAAFARLTEAGKYPGAEQIRACLSFIRKWQDIADPYEKIRVVRDARDALVTFSLTFDRLKDFFENRAGRWESWCKTIDSFAEFQSEIEADPGAFEDFSRLRRILEMQSPWDELDGVDGLIARIKPVYERIRDERFNILQQDTLQEINRMIEDISTLLENAHARDEVRNTALVELQKIRKVIETENPGSRIFKHLEFAEEAFEKAQDIVLSRS